MNTFTQDSLTQLYIPSSSSHKGDNGKVLIIGGSKLFHAAPLWALSIASKIVDMVFFASVPENNEIVLSEKKLFKNGIVIARSKIDDYIQEADCILIGPGLPRVAGAEAGDDDTKELSENLLKKYPHKKWVIDGGSLQTIDPKFIPPNAILTPHQKEFEILFSSVILEEGKPTIGSRDSIASLQNDNVCKMANRYHCVILLKGEADTVCSSTHCVTISGGNAGMTKGGTGDVLAGLTASLYAQNNDAFLVAQAASFLNKKAGESLSQRVGLYFNSTDLVEEIPLVMKKYLSV